MITATVGDKQKKAVNKADEVRVVRRLFSTVPPAKGGPSELLDTASGICDAELVNLIRTFQGVVLRPAEMRGVEGVIAPNSPSLKALITQSQQGAEEQRLLLAAAERSVAEAKQAMIEASKKTTLDPRTWLVPALFVRDTRIKGGGVKADKADVKTVDELTPLTSIVDWVAQRVEEYSSVVNVHIMAHGYAGKVTQQVCAPIVGCLNIQSTRGGLGIQLGQDDLTLKTVSSFAKWKGIVNRIILHSCAACDVTPGSEGKHGDGRFLCRQLAKTVGAPVVASNKIQMYAPGYMANLYKVDFGEWEGDVFLFKPDGTSKKINQ